MEHSLNTPDHWAQPFAITAPAGSAPEPERVTRIYVQGGYVIGAICGPYPGYAAEEKRPTGSIVWVIYPPTHSNDPARFQIEDETFPGAIVDKDPAQEMPWAEQLRAIQRSLGLPTTALAEALQVSRVALYDWLNGALPNLANQSRIATLASIAGAWSALNLGPMSHFWNLPPQSGGASLRRVLSSQRLTLEAFSGALRNLGIGKRVLPPRTSKPVMVDRESRARRRASRRKPWAVRGDSD